MRKYRREEKENHIDFLPRLWTRKGSHLPPQNYSLINCWNKSVCVYEGDNKHFEKKSKKGTWNGAGVNNSLEGRVVEGGKKRVDWEKWI